MLNNFPILKKYHKFIINDPILKTEALFVIGCNTKKFIQIMQSYRIASKYYKYLDDDSTLGTVININLKNKRFRVVWVRDKNAPEEIVHEVFHLITGICYDRGIPIIADIGNGECGDEAAAYLMEYYIKNVFDKLGINNKIKKLSTV